MGRGSDLTVFAVMPSGERVGGWAERTAVEAERNIWDDGCGPMEARGLEERCHSSFKKPARGIRGSGMRDRGHE